MLIFKNFWLTLFALTTTIALMNFVSVKNHFMILLLMLELIGLMNLILWSLTVFNFGVSMSPIFLLMVMMVAESTVSLSLLVSISRAKSGELEASSVSL